MRKDLKTKTELDPVNCLFLTQGFSRLFWGLLMAALLYFSDSTLAISKNIGLPAYFFGSAMALWGARALRMAGPITPAWQPLTRILTLLLALTIYFAPFVQWWKSTHTMWMFANVMAFKLAAISAFVAICLLCIAASRKLEHRSARNEACFALALVILLLAVPYFIAVFLVLFDRVEFIVLAFFMNISQTDRELPIWMTMVPLVACALVLVNLLKIKALFQERLISATNQPDAFRSL